MGEGNLGKYLIQRRSQVKSSGTKLPEVHDIGKGLDLNIQPEKQIIKPKVVSKGKATSQIKPRLQGRVDVRHEIKTPVPPLIYKPIVKLAEKPIE